MKGNYSLNFPHKSPFNRTPNHRQLSRLNSIISMARHRVPTSHSTSLSASPTCSSSSSSNRAAQGINPCVYHGTKVPPKTKAAELDVVVLSAPRSSAPCWSSTNGKLAIMPLSSKMEFCEFCVACAGNRSKLDVKPRVAFASEPDAATAAAEEKLRRVPLPWELFQPALMDRGTLPAALLGPTNSDELKTQEQVNREMVEVPVTPDNSTVAGD